MLTQDATLDLTVRLPVRVAEFGRSELLLDGEPVKTKIRKSWELLAWLVGRRAVKAERAELLEALFDGRDDRSTRAYLRGAIRELRDLLPGGAIAGDGGSVVLTDAIQVTSDSVAFEVQVQEAHRLQGRARLRGLLLALEQRGTEPFLDGVKSAWAEERRRHIASLVSDVHFEAAEAAYAEGEFAQARRLLGSLLAADPFREAAWRLSMRVASALGDEDGIVQAFRGCERALEDLATQPSSVTQQLLAELRR
jgi:DNA-binding SARP family transcriptional activator